QRAPQDQGPARLAGAVSPAGAAGLPSRPPPPHQQRAKGEGGGIAVQWVKLSSRYYFDPAVIGLPAADTEVLFVRSLAYAGDQDTGGFIPEHVVGGLCRRRRYQSCVSALVDARLWTPVPGGWQIRAWSEWQSELEAITARRRADRDRKRRQRERAKGTESAVKSQVKDMSRDMSADSHVTVRSREREGEPTPTGSVGSPSPYIAHGGRAAAPPRAPDGAAALTTTHVYRDQDGVCADCGLPAGNRRHLRVVEGGAA